MTKLQLSLIALVSLLLIGFGVASYSHHPTQEPILGTDFSYTSSTMATSSVGIYGWTNILAADSSRGYASFCNDSRTSNSAIYLGLGATTTVSSLGMAGIAIPSNSCYNMTADRMFNGVIYAIASFRHQHPFRSL